MAVQISGVLKDGAGKPIQNCTIQLKAKRNSTTVLVNTVASENPDEAGRYSMDVEHGQYSVTLLVEGFPPSHAGTITVYEGSRPGTLNDFLGAMTEDDVMPEALRRFEAMVEEAARNAEAASQSAAAAKKSETAAASSKNAAKTSETNAANSAQAAASSQTASANSATAAKKSETNAKNSETAAKTSETNAKSSQTAAKTSETNAKVSETAAKNSQAAAAESENAAAGSATSAAGSATAAANSQKAAKASETNAKSSQTAAKTSETNAKASETAAKSSQDAAAESESAAAGSATAAANSQKAAKTSETNAKTSETTAANSAQASAASQTAAKASEDAAREYASQAAEPYKQVLQPLPDVWIPFNDSLDMIAGFSPGYKQITVGDDVIKMPSDKVVSFKRASGATYINKSGVLTVAEVDEPRFEREGLLIEGQRTNYHLNSLTPSKWGATTSVTITESGVDEFGFTYGRFQIKDEKIGTNTTMNIAAVSGGRGVDVTGTEKYVTTSCRVKSDSANIQCRIRFERYDGSEYFYLADAYLNITDMSIRKTGGGAARITARAEKESNGWIYFEVTYQSEAIDNMVGSQIQIAPPVSPGTYLGGEYLDVTTPQFEGGSCASSFIISDTVASTRASDIVTVPIKNNLYNLPFTVLCEVHKNWYKTPNAAPRVFDTGCHQTGAAIILGFGSSADYDGFPYCDIGGANRRVNENASLEKMVMGMRVKSDQSTCSVSNGRISSETKTTWSYIQNTAIIRIGGQTTAGLRHLFGHVRNFRIWHKALTDAQVGELI
ncbi:prophage tail fiber N-terminal domain-containing protein [Escherichia coli]|nr:prophage tail fiber N-terminal domain-containing protein [Escherichia coli]MCQ1974544.1 prophage tail fiber N-terminal domain-containing protein [Escherichia coli]